MKRKRIYISGPITGTTDYKERFAAAADFLRKGGYKPVNPTTMFGWFQFIFEKCPYRLQVLIDCLVLSTCKGIYLMNNWRSSAGATLEKAVADFLMLELNTQTSVRYPGLQSPVSVSPSEVFKGETLHVFIDDFRIWMGMDDAWHLRINMCAHEVRENNPVTFVVRCDDYPYITDMLKQIAKKHEGEGFLPFRAEIRYTGSNYYFHTEI